MTPDPSSPEFSARPTRPLAFALAYAAAIGLAALADIALFGEAIGSRALAVAGLFALAGLPAGLLALLIVRRWAARRRTGTRFLLLAGLLLVFQILATAFGHGLLQRAYFSVWHDDPFTTLWFFQQFFTFAGAAWVFLVMGARLIVPAGLLVILAAAWWETRPRPMPVMAAARAGAIEPVGRVC